MFPPIVVDHRPRGIETSRNTHHPFDERILPRMLLAQAGKAHALVDRYPGDDAGMVVVAPHRILPLGGKPLFRSWRPLTRIGHLFPNQQAQTIAPVKPARILDLLVLPDSIETKHLDPADVRLQGFISWSSEVTVGPETLVQHHLHIGRLAIEKKLPTAKLDATQSDIRAHLVE